jgi:hypothetical protein
MTEVERLAKGTEIVAERELVLAKEKRALDDEDRRLADEKRRRMAAVAMQHGAGAPRQEGLEPGLLANAERRFGDEQSRLPMHQGPGPSVEAGLHPGVRMSGQLVCPHPQDQARPLVCVETHHQHF